MKNVRRFAPFLLILVVSLLFLPTLRVYAQTDTAPNNPDASSITLLILVVVLLLAMPIVYYVLNMRKLPARSLLIVSTDEAAVHLVQRAARRVGYQAVTVYRYEDALEKLRQNTQLSIIVIDDSVPQYEAGMLLSMLQGSPIGIRPLILIHDSSELGQTAPSYRAEAVVTRPLTDRAVEAAIRQVSDRIDSIL